MTPITLDDNNISTDKRGNQDSHKQVYKTSRFKTMYIHILTIQMNRLTGKIVKG